MLLKELAVDCCFNNMVSHLLPNHSALLSVDRNSSVPELCRRQEAHPKAMEAIDGVDLAGGGE